MRRLPLLLVLPLAAACAGPGGPREPVRFAEATRPAGSEAFPNWTRPPRETMNTLETGIPQVQSVARTAAGTSGAQEAQLRFGDVEYKIKDKRVPDDLDGINNAPRKELAAYAIQRLFLDPEDYVVPATTVRCIPIDLWRKYSDPSAEPTIEGTQCVLAAVALWLQDVTVPKVLFDRERFLSEPGYAYYMSNMNVFTYLIEHQDGRQGNFLVSKDDRRQVFAIDNGVSFGQPWPFYNWFVPNWDKLRVPAVRKDTVERLRKLERADLDVLTTVVQLDSDGKGELQLVAPGPPIDPDEGARRRGTTVQFGLTRDEIDDVWERIQDLIQEVDDGELPVF